MFCGYWVKGQPSKGTCEQKSKKKKKSQLYSPANRRCRHTASNCYYSFKTQTGIYEMNLGKRHFIQQIQIMFINPKREKYIKTKSHNQLVILKSYTENDIFLDYDCQSKTSEW